MAVTLKTQIDFDFSGIQKLIVAFPELNARFLSMVGSRGRRTLREKYLRGQAIQLKDSSAEPKDKKGRYLVSSKVGKGAKYVTIKSYPLNLFERRQVLRSGKTLPGKKVFPQLKKDIMANMSGYAKEFEDGILEKEFRKIGIS